MIYLLSFALLIITTYPSSPVLMNFILFGNIGFVLLLIFIIASFKIFNFYEKSKFNKPASKTTLIMFFLFSFIQFINFILLKNPTAIRDFLTLFTIFLFTTCVKKRIFMILVNKYCIILTSFIFISFVVSILFHTSFLNAQNWEVQSMNLDRDLPISIRAFGSDFRYFFPLYLSIITQDYASILAGNNLSVFKRLPFIFTEPTYYWGYTMPIGFLMFFYKSIPYKLTMSIFLLFCGLISYSTYGIITVLLTCLLLLLIKEKKHLYHRTNVNDEDLYRGEMLRMLILLNLLDVRIHSCRMNMLYIKEGGFES